MTVLSNAKLDLLSNDDSPLQCQNRQITLGMERAHTCCHHLYVQARVGSLNHSVSH
jgi:hypothetical protein